MSALQPGRFRSPAALARRSLAGGLFVIGDLMLLLFTVIVFQLRHDAGSTLVAAPAQLGADLLRGVTCCGDQAWQRARGHASGCTPHDDGRNDTATRVTNRHCGSSKALVPLANRYGVPTTTNGGELFE